MKNVPVLFLTLFSWSASLHAQTDCALFYPLKPGVKLEYTYFDKKDKMEGKTLNTVKSVTKQAGFMEAVIASTAFDKKGQEQFSGEYTVRCENGTVRMEAGALLNPAMQQSLSNMEVDIQGEGLSIPGKLETGQQLPDAGANIKAGAGGVNIVDMTILITDRRVVGQDTITTPAGTFACYKVSQATEVKMMLGKSFSSVEYYAEGAGLIRSETFDKNGNLEGYMVLSLLEK